MKTATAKSNYLRIAPRKVRLVANVIKGMSVNEAEAQLLLNPKRAAEAVLKLLRSAVANAKNKKLVAETMIVKEIKVDKGPMLKRFMPRAQGRATPIHKFSSHIYLVLTESEKTAQPRFKIVKPERIKKSKLEKMKREEERYEHEHEHSNEEVKPKKEIKQKSEKKLDTGFIKRMFRRKAI